ncbi:MAG: ACT domain-containing protein [Leptospiraceae bacterium]|nr:ACT domain-containing protein [Leptospiraceae bacterium]MCP5495069.1 ACT domain-containing protein [Leptospiraceae bacterium]
MNTTTIELLVNDHPGVMSHVTGLFSRRYFNLLGIVCYRTVPKNHSKIFLLVENDQKIEQIIKQLSKLFDVLSVKLRNDIQEEKFVFLQSTFE